MRIGDAQIHRRHDPSEYFHERPGRAELMPWLPMRLLIATRFGNEDKLKRLPVPVLILHSRKDTTIPFHHAEKNFAAATGPKCLVELAGDHNDALLASAEVYRHAVSEFLAKLRRAGTN